MLKILVTTVQKNVIIIGMSDEICLILLGNEVIPLRKENVYRMILFFFLLVLTYQIKHRWFDFFSLCCIILVNLILIKKLSSESYFVRLGSNLNSWAIWILIYFYDYFRYNTIWILILIVINVLAFFVIKIYTNYRNKELKE